MYYMYSTVIAKNRDLFRKLLVILLEDVFTIYGSFANIWTDPGGRAA